MLKNLYFKFFLLLLIIAGFQKTNAQAVLVPLNESSILDVMTNNKYAGRNVNHSIVSKYDVTTSFKRLSSSDSLTILTNMLTTSGVISCTYQPSLSHLVVYANKEIESFNIIKIQDHIIIIIQNDLNV